VLTDGIEFSIDDGALKVEIPVHRVQIPSAGALQLRLDLPSLLALRTF